MLAKDCAVRADPQPPAAQTDHLHFFAVLPANPLRISPLLPIHCSILCILHQICDGHIFRQLISHVFADDCLGLALWAGEAEPTPLLLQL